MHPVTFVCIFYCKNCTELKYRPSNANLRYYDYVYNSDSNVLLHDNNKYII